MAAAVCIAMFPLLSSAPPAVAKSYYLALGASLAQGFGSSSTAADYVSLIYKHESPHYHPLILKSFACGGTTTNSFIHGPGCEPGTQLGNAEAFLNANHGKVAFVTIDIGANEMVPCVDGSAINMGCVEGALAEDSANLPIIIAGLQAASPGVRIYAMNYYDPFLADGEKGEPGLLLAHETLEVIDRLNAELESIYGVFSVPVADTAAAFESQDFSPTGIFMGALLPQNIANVCTWTHMCPERDIHTNDAGYAKLAATFEPVIDASFEAPLSIDATAVPAANVGQTYAATLSASGGLPPLTWKHLGKLPPGLKLDAQDGIISGQPRKAGTYDFELGAVDQARHRADRSVSITVG